MNKIPFKVYRGSEEFILSKPYQDGYIYFSTDTKKIYLDADGINKMPMGGNSGIYYGKMVLDETPDENQKEFDFGIYDIDGNDALDHPIIPNVNDLILNEPDGCFYRVISIDAIDGDVTISTLKLTIAGSGGGSGSGGVGSLAGVTMDRLDKNSAFTSLYQSECKLGFYLKATDTSGEITGNGMYEVFVNNVKKATGIAYNDQDNYVDVGPYLPLGGPYSVRIVAYMDTGGSSNTSVSKTWQITTTLLELKWDYNELISTQPTDSRFEIKLSISGKEISKVAKIVIDDKYVITSDFPKETMTYVIENPAEYNLIHGAHKFEVYVIANISGQEITTNSIIKNILFIEEGNDAPIINCSFFEKNISQYNTVQIPIMIYKNDNINGIQVRLLENGIVKDIWENCENQVQYYWSYTPTVAGAVVLRIQSGVSEIQLVLNVEALDIDNEEVEDYAFRIKASDFASNNQLQNDDRFIFSEKFDWINGGLKTEVDNGINRQYICIKAGSRMDLNYKLFESKDVKTFGKSFKFIFKAAKCRDYDAQVLKCLENRKGVGIGKDPLTIDLEQNGTIEKNKYSVVKNNSIELDVDSISIDLSKISADDIEKTFNFNFVNINDVIYYCQSVSEIEKQITEDETKKYYQFTVYETYIVDSYLGINVQAQSAAFNSTNSSLSIPYCEDSYLELEIDISPLKNNGKMYITTWMDGVPCGIQNYSRSDDFTQNNPVNISIGSDDCDVYIYLVKVYERHLSDLEHLANFISDAPNAEEMYKRFKRNDILDEREEISPTKLAIANPDCRVHIYDIQKMTQSKKDKTVVYEYTQYHGSDQAVLSATNESKSTDEMYIKVQGTSSAAYGLAAYNLDSEFTKGFINADGEHIDTWSMNENSIGCNFFTTKVNVASCENANNALNQDWYNTFQPYKTVLRCKNAKARDTMEFTPGVLFITDRNTTTDSDNLTSNNVFAEIPGYTSNPYPKMYSICNMGNSKDNIHVFHDQENPLECCIEVNDNQEPQQWMVSNDFEIGDIDAGNEYYGFRYPDGAENATDTMKNGWKSFVDWMATSNPQPKYEEIEINSLEEFENASINSATGRQIDLYTFEDPENGQHNKVTSYNPSITKYYKLTQNIHGYTNEKLTEPASFNPYVFQGYYAPGYEEIQKNAGYVPLIKGCTISQYATKKTIYDYETDKDGNPVYDKDGNPVIVPGSGREIDVPYTHDTYEYRMAKMLSECEQHLCMDSVIYHYLFIERHCMIDNVAKNTFWSTEDCQVWNLTKNYDNDTADGNDNNGKFTRNYGMEVSDKLNANEYVFNAHESVWLAFIDGLLEAREWMFQKLESVTINGVERSAWDPKTYLDTFNSWQNCIPERVWIEDYYRKYIRPYEVYNDGVFLPMMEGGKKTHQRKQFETYQNYYTSSEYYGETAAGSSILIRGNGDNKLGYQLPVKVYADCYIRAAIGSGQRPNVKRRAKRNVETFIECPINKLNNTTFYIYLPQVYQEIGKEDGNNLSGFAPAQLSVSQATKLRKMVVGTIDSVENEGLTEVTFGNNDLLESLYIANCPKISDDLDLSNSPNLVELDARNSGFTEIRIADGAPVKKILLQEPTSLALYNLYNLEQMEINSYNSLSILDIDNIDNNGFDSKTVLLDRATNLNSYNLKNINWKITDKSEIGMFTQPDGSGDKYQGIQILEFLLKRTPGNNQLHAASLTGNLTVNSEALEEEDNSLEIYNRYAKKDYYPNLNIVFNDDNAKLYNVTVYGGNNTINWTRKIVPGTKLDSEFFKDGPYGAFNINSIQQAATAAQTFEFSGNWEVYINDELYPSQVNSANGYPNFNSPINGEIKFVPIFNANDRTYEIEFLDGSGEVAMSGTYNYGTPLSTLLEDLGSIPYKDDSNLSLYQTWDFKGYSLIIDGKNVVANDYTVSNDQTFYPVFELVEDIRNIVHLEYFGFKEVNYSENRSDIELGAEIFDAINGYEIYPTVKLKGKITLPSFYENKPVLLVSGFGSDDVSYIDEYPSEQLVTHIFCEKNSQLKEIGEKAFNKVQTLRYFDFSQNTIRRIKQYAFVECPLDAYAGEFKLSSKIYKIENNVFNRAFGGNVNPITIKIPGSIGSIGAYSFNVLRTRGGSVLMIGDQEDFSRLDLSKPNLGAIQKFAQNVENAFSRIEFYSNKYQNSDDVIGTENDVQITVKMAFGELYGAVLSINTPQNL